MRLAPANTDTAGEGERPYVDDRGRSRPRRSEVASARAGLAAIAASGAVLAWTGEQMMLMARRFVWLRPETWLLSYVWLGLLQYLLLFGAAWMIVRWGSRTPRFRAISEGALVSLAAVCFLLSFGSLATVTAVILAIGIGARVATLRLRWKTALHAWIRRTVGPFVFGAVMCASVAAAWYPFQEWWMYGRLPAAPLHAPNVLLIVLDTVRASDLSVYGLGRSTTPVLEAFAKSGVRFDRAISTAPWTLASHLSMFSGLFPNKMASPDIEANPGRVLPRSQPVLASVLAHHGYATAGFSANPSYATREWGMARGFAHYEDYPVDVTGFIQSTALLRRIVTNDSWRKRIQYVDVLVRKDAARMTSDVLRWLDKNHHGRPFFVFANYFDAHVPRVPPESYRRRFVRTPSRLEFLYTPFTSSLATETPADHREFDAQHDLYHAAIAAIDHQVGVLLEKMKNRHLLDNTIVIITADHGEMFGEHGRLGHGFDLFQTLLHVPLIVSYPRLVPAGESVAEPVSLADVPATILDLAGLDRGGIAGSSLELFWTGKSSESMTPIVSEDPRWYPRERSGQSQSIVVGRYKLIRHLCCQSGRGRRVPKSAELYDIDDDPREQSNLADRPNLAHLQRKLDSALNDALANQR